MNAGNLLERVAAEGVALTLARGEDGDKLIARPTAAVTPEILSALRKSKAEIVAALRASDLGLVARWSKRFGYVSIHDPTSGEWQDLRTKDAPDWAVRESRRRMELRKAGNRKARQLTSREMHEIWAAERSAAEEGIVEDYPVEEDG